MNRFRLTLLGGFELRGRAPAVVRLATRKAEALLAYLALAPERRRPREALASLLWGGSAEASARASLRQELSVLRRALGAEAIVTEGRNIVLAGKALEVDVLELRRCCVEGTPDALARAAELYRGELLPGLVLGEQQFDEWLRGERERLRASAAYALVRLVALRQESSDPEGALEAARRLLDIDPLEESAHRTLMRLLAGLGRREAALRQYQVCLNLLKRELGAEPDAETRALYNEILQRRQAAPAQPLPLEAFHDAPLAGRGAELAVLADHLEQARAGHGRTVLIEGEAGIGKTRLAEELQARAAAQGVRVLAARCYESQQTFPFGPWVEMFRAAGIAGDARLLAGIEAGWRQELARLMPEISAPAEETREEAAVGARRARVFEAIMRLVERLVQDGPLLVVIEDLHWADELSLRLLAAAGRRWRALPILLLVSARGEALPDAPVLRRSLQELERQAALARLRPAALSAEDTRELVRALLRHGAEEPTLARLSRRVWRASEGNPFVVLETMRALGRSQPAQGNEELPVAERVREMILGHLERVSLRARRLLGIAAVAGRETDFALLQHAARLGAHETSEALEELVRRQVLRAVGERFDFTHDRVRKVIDESLLAPARRLHHEAIAEALESLNARDLARVHDRLAYHYARGERDDRAAHYLARFAEDAARGGAHERALAALDEALTHLARSTAAADARQRFELVFLKSRSLFLLGRLPEVLELLLPEQALVDGVLDARLAAAFHFRVGTALSYTGRYADARRHAERALEAATACGDHTSAGKAHFLLAFGNHWSDPAASVRHAEQAAAILEAAGERWWLAQACWILGQTLALCGRGAEGAREAARACALASEFGDSRVMSVSAWGLGFVHSLAGEHDAALEACRRSVAVAPDIMSRATANGVLAKIHVERGEPEPAIALLADVIPQVEQLNFRQLHSMFVGVRGEAALLAGDREAALEFAGRAVEIAGAEGYPYVLGRSQRLLARVMQAMGDADQARTRFQEAIETFRGIGMAVEMDRTRNELDNLPVRTSSPAQSPIPGRQPA